MGERLKSKLLQFRETRGWTLEDVADLTGCSVTFISRLERGQRNAAPATKVTIARRLGARVSDLFEVDPIADDDRIPAAAAS